MLNAQNITVSIGDKDLVKDVSFQVASGELVALCGPNGAGKSTLLRVLSGESNPTSGTVLFNETPLQQWGPSDLSKKRAKLSQESQLTFAFLVGEVVEMGRLPHDTPGENDRIVQQSMDKVGITHLSQRGYTSLSGGEKQRVHLARILAQLEDGTSAPKLLLLDEPTSALDLMHQEVALEIAHALAKERGYGVVVVLHDLNLAAAWADRIVLLKEARYRYCGEPKEVLTPDIIREIYGVNVFVLSHPTTGRPILTINRDDKPPE